MTDADLGLYLPTVVGTTLAAPADIGGAASATKITGGAVGELLFAMSSNLSGGGNKVQRQKAFQANDATADLAAAVMWIDNLMDVSAGGFITTAQSTSSLDGAGKYLRIIGNDASADAQDEFPLAGTSVATGGVTFADRWCATLHDLVTDALTPAAGWISLFENGVAIAVMPPGAYSVTAEIEIGLESTLDDTNTAADAGTDPAGITFSRPRTIADGLAVANSGTLTAGSKQGFWLRWTCAEARKASADVEIYPLVIGNA
jgi:hypothetical protein